MRYPVKITKDDNHTYLVTFPDVPGAITFGDTREEALERASDALLTVVDALIKDKKDVPEPSAITGSFVDVPAIEAIRIELHRQMRDAEITKAELGRRLNWKPMQVDRLFQVRHASRLDQMEAAFGALGRRVEFRFPSAVPATGVTAMFATRRRAAAADRPAPRAAARAAARETQSGSRTRKVGR